MFEVPRCYVMTNIDAEQVEHWMRHSGGTPQPLNYACGSWCWWRRLSTGLIRCQTNVYPGEE